MTDPDEAYMLELEEVWKYAKAPTEKPEPRHVETLMEQRMREAGLIR